MYTQKAAGSDITGEYHHVAVHTNEHLVSPDIMHSACKTHFTHSCVNGPILFFLVLSRITDPY